MILINIIETKGKKIRSSIKGKIKLLRKIVITIPEIVMIIYIEAFGILLYKLGYLKSL